jgi:hypothetical protein
MSHHEEHNQELSFWAKRRRENIPRKLAVCVVTGVPVIVYGGIIYSATGSLAATFVHDALLIAGMFLFALLKVK